MRSDEVSEITVNETEVRSVRSGHSEVYVLRSIEVILNYRGGSIPLSIGQVISGLKCPAPVVQWSSAKGFVPQEAKCSGRPDPNWTRTISAVAQC